MKTDDLIVMLATGAEPVVAHAPLRRYAVAITLGLTGAILLMATLLRVRSDLAEAILLPTFWTKVGFVAAITVVGVFATARLSRPGARIDWLPAVLATPVLMMWAVSVYTLSEADPGQRSALFLGQTWKSCPLLIALLSAPVFAALMWAVKGLAPTRPRFAGFAAGLLAGALAALVYCLHCPETAAPFVGFWYLLGMLIPAGTGAWLGGSLLRW